MEYRCSSSFYRLLTAQILALFIFLSLSNIVVTVDVGLSRENIRNNESWTNEIDNLSHRNLQRGSKSKKSRGGKQGKGDFRGFRQKTQSSRLSTLITSLISEPLPESFAPVEWSKPVNSDQKSAIFTVAMSPDFMPRDVINFAGTARKVGFDGDIVIFIIPESRPSFVEKLKVYDIVVFSTTPVCTGKGQESQCSFYSLTEKFSINMIRYYLYRWWAQLYSPSTMIMVADFRDVFFQSNPFTYRTHEWAPPVAQLAVFQEAHPNKVINRCTYNAGWIEDCYGKEALRLVGHNTVSCSGVSMGTRDAIIAYSYLMTQQVRPEVRLGANATARDNIQCTQTNKGVDQGFHNYLVYTNAFEKYFDVRIFAQGEGPVNTVGGFYGNKQRLQFSLEQWGILKGEVPKAIIANWNGDSSPVVHQLDRYLPHPPFNSNYKGILNAMEGL